MISKNQSMRNISQDEADEMIIPPDCTGMRIDKVLSGLFPDYSRSWLQERIREGKVLVNDQACLPKYKVVGGEVLRLNWDSQRDTTPAAALAEDIPLNCVYEDDDLLVINKPAGLVVHPGAGNPDGTVQNALLFHYPEIEQVPRFGIVHRLDKNTSGLLLVAKSLAAHTHLTDQIQNRQISREYLAVVYGNIVAGGSIDEPIGRHPVDRTKMVVRQGGRQAITHYRVSKRFRQHTCLYLKLETGRTHQIRVHLAHLNKPIVGDPMYGGRQRIPKGGGQALIDFLMAFKRQALHARRLSLNHPITGEVCAWQAPVPEDIQTLLQLLQQDSEAHSG